MELQIEPCKDAFLLATLNQQVQELHHQLLPGVFKPFDQEQVEVFFEELLLRPGVQAWIAMMGEEVAGYMVIMVKKQPESAFKYASAEVHIDQIGVQPAFRGRGIASLLLEKVKAVAREEQIGQITLDHWTQNFNAEAAFISLGFENCRRGMVLNL